VSSSHRPETGPSPLSQSERARRLDRAMQGYIQRGYQVTDRTEASAQLVERKDASFWGLLLGFALMALVVAFSLAHFLSLAVVLIVGLVLGLAFAAIWKGAPPGTIYLAVEEDGETVIVNNPSWL
jgi:hypothetical protein